MQSYTSFPLLFLSTIQTLPQFGGFNNFQNCLGSQCNQNNIGVFPTFGGFGQGNSQNCFGSQCNQNNGGNVGGFGSLGRHNQNCIGSRCNRNNFGKRKREVTQDSNESSTYSQDNIELVHPESVLFTDKEVPVPNPSPLPPSYNIFFPFGLYFPFGP